VRHENSRPETLGHRHIVALTMLRAEWSELSEIKELLV